MGEEPGMFKIFASWYEVSQTNIQIALMFGTEGSFKCKKGVDF